jgi:hypothetical protein
LRGWFRALDDPALAALPAQAEAIVRVPGDAALPAATRARVDLVALAFHEARMSLEDMLWVECTAPTPRRRASDLGSCPETCERISHFEPTLAEVGVGHRQALPQTPPRHLEKRIGNCAGTYGLGRLSGNAQRVVSSAARALIDPSLPTPL